MSGPKERVGIMCEAADALRDAARAVDSPDSSGADVERGTVALAAMGFDRTDVARALAGWLDYTQQSSSAGQHRDHALELANLLISSVR